jgi:transcriptional regulator with XRE-family HTH domain
VSRTGHSRRPIGRIEAARRAAGMTQLEVAQKVGLSRSYVVMIEGGWIPPLSRRAQIAAAIGVEVEVLWPEEIDALIAAGGPK